MKPAFVEALSNRGVALNELGSLNESLNSYNRAIELKSDLAELHFNKSNVLTDLLRIDEALKCLDRAIELKTDLACAHNKFLFLTNYIYSFDPSKYLLCAINFGNLISDKSQPKFTSWRVHGKHAKLNIGFVSGDLRNHPVGFFIEGLVKCLNKDKFNLFAFPTFHISDDLTGRIRSQFSNWISICGLTDKDAAIKIHDQNIDVLFDLSGHTDHNRLGVFSYKPAPVQVTWLGYFASTGLPEIDYFLGDPVMSPKEESANFSEKIWNLEETWLCFTPPSQPIPIACLPALKNEYLTFGCFGNLSKVNDQVVKLWATVLASVPNSKLFLKSKQLEDLDVVSEIQSKFLFHKIKTDRLILEGSESRNRYFDSYNRIDIVLDTFPYPGGTTSFEALWMGVPVVTLKGDRFLSRLGASILTNAGLVDWVATSNDDYLKRAISFGKDIPRLSKIRSDLRGQVLKTPLFNSVRFAKHFENAVLGMRSSNLKKSC
jgi:predicted O-linked N-acetylglucosamine transferase (SPINDLY family)